MPGGEAASEYTSTKLELGVVYSRRDLKSRFSISDSTINNGIFRPKGTRSVWLFVTQTKTPDRTPYEDDLVGDVLHMQGQTEGRTDDLIIHHRARELELLLFYRQSKSEHPHGGFRYEGPFEYVSHKGSRPTSFVLHRVDGRLADLAQAANSEDAFDPTNQEDARKKTLAAIVRRQGQPAFRRALLRAYRGRCAITGCDFEPALEAAHISPYLGEHTNDITNGVLLRGDIHTLFDLGFLGVDTESWTVVVAGVLSGTFYEELSGKTIALPPDEKECPSTMALDEHARRWGLTAR